jgi:hypothetical protein
MDGRYLTIYWRCIKTSSFLQIVSGNTTTFTVPTLDGHLTNKLYVDGSIATAVATETASILADDNTFTGLNSFTQDLGTTGINNTGNLVMERRRVRYGGTANKSL